MTYKEFFCTDDRTQPQAGARFRVKLKDGRQYENISMILTRPSGSCTLNIYDDRLDLFETRQFPQIVAVVFACEIIAIEEYPVFNILRPDKPLYTEMQGAGGRRKWS